MQNQSQLGTAAAAAGEWVGSSLPGPPRAVPCWPGSRYKGKEATQCHGCLAKPGFMCSPAAAVQKWLWSTPSNAPPSQLGTVAKTAAALGREGAWGEGKGICSWAGREGSWREDSYLPEGLKKSLLLLLWSGLPRKKVNAVVWSAQKEGKCWEPGCSHPWSAGCCSCSPLANILHLSMVFPLMWPSSMVLSVIFLR